MMNPKDGIVLRVDFMDKMNHKQKVRLARSMLSNEEIINKKQK